MEKRNKITLGILIFITMMVVLFCIYSVKKHPEIETSDSIKFKEEYESLNGVVDNNTKEVYSNVIISSDNPIVYKTDEEILDIMKTDTAIIYFGYASCNDCRSIISPLLEIAKDYNDKRIYYVDIKDIRDIYNINDGKVELTKESSKAYKEILKLLKNYLLEYYIVDEMGQKYDTKVTRMHAPTVLAVDKGKIKAFYDLSMYDTNNDEENTISIDEVINNIFKSIYNTDTCETSTSC